MELRGVRIGAPHGSLHRCEPTCNQLRALTGIRGRRLITEAAFNRANEILLGHALTTSHDASVCIGWWIASRKADKVKLEKEAFESC